MSDFKAIRPVRGSANNGFEELCCQLAASEALVPEARFIRNGTPDGGVEGYWVDPDGDEHGWQAKYFFEIDKSQWQQLDESVTTALTKHPRLVRYTVCLPIDLPDARTDKQTSLRQKWEERVSKWQEAATARGMTVVFELWGQYELLSRLSLEKHAGRRWFWFQQTELSPNWFSDHLQEVIQAAGPRYNRELNVELPIGIKFESLGYTHITRERIFAGRRKCKKAIETLAIRLQVEKDDDLETAYRATRSSSEALFDSIELFDDAPPTRERSDNLFACLEQAMKCAAELSALAESAIGDALRDESGDRKVATQTRASAQERYSAVERYRSTLFDLQNLLEKVSAELMGRPALLLTGQAGNGKTHLLCDVARHRIEVGDPTLVVLGEQLGNGDVWHQIVVRLGLRCTRDELLGALDSAGEAAGTRALIFIDAINEAVDMDWRNELPRILEVLARYPRIGIALSCRNTYERQIVRDDLVPGRISRVEHDGFASRRFESLSAFCHYYRIETLNAPPLSPEFDNPLFLKLFCQGLCNSGLTRPPKGHHGLWRIFLFLIDSVNRKLHHPTELDFPEDDRIVHRAVKAIADAMLDEGRYSVSRSKAQAILEGVLPRPGLGYSRSLLKGLIAEGILADDHEWRRGEETPRPIVRFGYERLADFQLGNRLLDRHFNPENPRQGFGDDEPLGKIFSERKVHRLRGLLAAMIVLVPERTGRELSELNPRFESSRAYREAFLEALPLREGKHITPVAISFTRKLLDEGDYRSGRYSQSDEVLDSLIQVSAQPGHPLNARWLHEYLLSFPMSERDLRWSTFLHRARKDGDWKVLGAVERLLDWAWPDNPEGTDPCAGFDDEVVTLAVLTLTWCLSTANRFIRDRATKALVCILQHRLYIFPMLLKEFSAIDDLYVAERLYCAIYGCVMRCVDAQQVEPVASAVFSYVFANGAPPAHALLRDYARGVIEYAHAVGCKLSIEPSLIRPPYRSEALPEQVPSWKELKHTYDAADYSSLILSLWPGHGDFARYVIGDSLSGLHTWTDKPDPFEETRRLGRERIELPQPFARKWYAVKHRTTLPKTDVLINEPFESVGDESHEGCANDLYNEAELEPLNTNFITEVGQFISTLSSDDRKLLFRHLEAEARWRHALEAASVKERGMHGEYDFVARWIMKRVMEIGWTPDRFAAFDREVNSGDRQAHKAERIGKKYQWLAYHEFAARLFDHKPFQYSSWESQRYEGPWQQSFRDIDPSFLVKRAPLEPKNTLGWWVPLNNLIMGCEHLSDQDWLVHRESIPDFRPLLAVREPTNSTQWFNLQTSSEWDETYEQQELRGSSKRRQLTFSLGSFIVRPSDLHTLADALAIEQWTGQDVTAIDIGRQFLGE